MARNIHSEALHGFERDREASTHATERRNMRCGIIHGAFFHMATAFADPYAIIPLFLAGFTDSRALIGLVVSLVEAVGVVPQIAVANRLRSSTQLGETVDAGWDLDALCRVGRSRGTGTSGPRSRRSRASPFHGRRVDLLAWRRHCRATL